MTNWDAGMRTVARLLQEDVPDLTAREREFLYDLAREEARYPMPTVRKIAALARRARNAAARDAFAELVRAESTPLEQQPPVRETFDVETASTGPADVAQRMYETNPNPSTWSRCRDLLYRQMVATRDAFYAVMAAAPRAEHRDWV